MSHWSAFFEQGLLFFLYYENLLSLAVLAILVVPNNFNSFSKGLYSILLFSLSQILILVFGTLGFHLEPLMHFEYFLFASVLLLAFWNFTLRDTRGGSRKRAQTPRYVFSVLLGLLHGLPALSFFDEIGRDFSHGLGQAFIFGLGLLVFAFVLQILLAIIFALINAFLRVRPREWTLVLTAVALGLSVGFLL
jgi:hypothetical protein